MSDSNGPVRRRRIAGETGPAGPAKKSVPVTKAAKKPATAKKADKTDKPATAKKVDKPATAKNVDKPATAKKTEPAAKVEPAKKPARKTAKPVTAPKAAAAGSATAVAPVAKKAAPKKPATVTRPVAVPSSATRGTSVDERPAGSRPARRDLLWLVPATLLALASLALGVLWIVSPPGTSDGDLDASRRQASSAAAGAAETIFSFRYDQLDQHLTASKALMTKSFAKDFDKIAPALTELAPQRQIQVQAAVRDAAALPCGDECSPGKADVLVFVDQARLVGGTSTPTVFANRIKVSMVKNSDGWRVSNIRAL